MKKQFLVILTLLFLATAALAAVTVTVNTPADGATLLSRTDNKCIDVNFTVTDTNAAAAIHTASIYYDFGDSNSYIATDINLNGGDECSLTPDVNWNGATCSVNYCFTTHDPGTGAYVLDVNVASGPTSADYTSGGEGIISFRIDAGILSSSGANVSALIPLVVAAILIGGLMAISYVNRDNLTPGMFVMMGVIAVSLFIAIIVISEILA